MEKLFKTIRKVEGFWQKLKLAAKNPKCTVKVKFDGDETWKQLCRLCIIGEFIKYDKIYGFKSDDEYVEMRSDTRFSFIVTEKLKGLNNYCGYFVRVTTDDGYEYTHAEFQK